MSALSLSTGLCIERGHGRATERALSLQGFWVSPGGQGARCHPHFCGVHRFLGLLPGTPAEVHCARVAWGAQEFLVPVWERTMCSVACAVDLGAQSLAVNSGNEVGRESWGGYVTFCFTFFLCKIGTSLMLLLWFNESV